jgi:hypothetical protein
MRKYVGLIILGVFAMPILVAAADPVPAAKLPTPAVVVVPPAPAPVPPLVDPNCPTCPAGTVQYVYVQGPSSTGCAGAAGCSGASSCSGVSAASAGYSGARVGLFGRLKARRAARGAGCGG